MIKASFIEWRAQLIERERQLGLKMGELLSRCSERMTSAAEELEAEIDRERAGLDAEWAEMIEAGRVELETEGEPIPPAAADLKEADRRLAVMEEVLIEPVARVTGDLRARIERARGEARQEIAAGADPHEVAEVECRVIETVRQTAESAVEFGRRVRSRRAEIRRAQDVAACGRRSRVAARRTAPALVAPAVRAASPGHRLAAGTAATPAQVVGVTATRRYPMKLLL